MTNLNLKIKEQSQPDENLGSFYMGRMRPSVPAKRILPKGMLTFVMLFAFAAIIWYAYPRGQERYSDMDIPVIAADKAVYKFKPDDPGGMEVLHQDSTVFDPLEKTSPDKVDKVRPKPEEPMVKPQAAKASPIDKVPQNLGLQAVPHGTEKIISAPEEKPAPPPVVKKEEAKAPVVAAPVPKPAEPVKQEAAAKPQTPPPAPAKTVASAEPPKGEAVPSIETVNSEPLTPPPAAMPPKTVTAAPAKTAATVAATTAAKPATPAKASAPSPSGVFIQFGAYHDNKGARDEWTELEKKFPAQLKSLTMRTEVNIGPKGALTRLQAGRMPEAQAKQVCDAMKAAKEPCIIVHE